MSEGKTTRDHVLIKEWAEARGGHPSTVERTEWAGEAGILRLDFNPPDEGLVRISWDKFFEKFDDAGLSFFYEEKTADGKISRFHRFVRQQDNPKRV